MALDSYANLKASVQSRSKRRDVSQDQLDEYIDLAESEMYYNDTAPLRIRGMEARATISASTSSRFLPLPTGFLNMRALHIVQSSGNTDIRYKAPELMSVDGTSGKPKFFTITTQLEFDKTPDDTYTLEMQYLRKIDALSDSVTSNIILTDRPNIYLNGALWALFQDAREEELAEYYYAKFIKAISGYNKADKRGRYGPAPAARIEGATP